MDQVINTQLTFTCSNYLKNVRTRCETCLKLTIKTPEQPHWRHSCVFIVNLNIFHTFFSASIVDFEHVNVSWLIYSTFKFYGKSMHKAHIRIILKNGWKYVLSSEHVQIKRMLSPSKKRILSPWFLEIILLCYDLFCCSYY